MAASMKLYYDKRLKDPTYYIQQGFRNGKKTTTKNIKRLGKHSELLLITDDPLEYAKNEVKKMNEEYRSGRSEFVVTMDFNERIPSSDSPCSNSTSLNIGYLYLKDIYAKLNLSDFFKSLIGTISIKASPLWLYYTLFMDTHQQFKLLHQCYNFEIREFNTYS